MTCEEALDRPPDDSPEAAAHLASCASCRAREEAFARDGALLAAGLRGLAARPGLEAAILRRVARASRFRRAIPVAAAAALFLGILALVLRPEGGELPAAEREDSLPEPVFTSEDPLWGAVIATDPAAGTVAVSAGADDRVLPGQVLTLYRRGGAAETEVGTVRIERVEPGWSSGRLVDRRADPQVGDFFVSERLLGPEERARLLEYLFTFRPVPEREILDLVGRLEADPGAGPRLLALGAPVRILLEGDRIDLARKVRAREAIARDDDLDRRVRQAGWDHDVEFLARLRDPRAHARLRSILSGVRPFSREGVPPPGARLSATLHDWWNAARDRLVWDPRADRWRER